MLGNIRDARIAYRLTTEDYEKPGWSILGEGSTRIAWLSPTKVVYKVPICSFDHMTNIEERQKYLEYKKVKIKGWKLAPCFTYSFKVPEMPNGDDTAYVNAQYYVQGVREPVTYKQYVDSPLAQYVYQSFQKFGLNDDHLDQYRIVGKTRVIFDYAV